MKPLRVPSIKNLEGFSPSEWLANPANIKGAIFECFEDGDLEALKEILRSHFEAIGYQAALKAAKVPKRTFHHALSSSGNPTAKTLMNMVAGVLKAAS